MNNTMNAAEVMLDTLSAVMGDYAPRKRRLLLDFKDDHGQDRNMDAIVWHNPKTTAPPLASLPLPVLPSIVRIVFPTTPTTMPTCSVFFRRPEKSKNTMSPGL